MRTDGLHRRSSAKLLCKFVAELLAMTSYALTDSDDEAWAEIACDWRWICRVS